MENRTLFNEYKFMPVNLNKLMAFVGKMGQFLMKQDLKHHRLQITNNDNQFYPMKASNPGVWDALDAADKNKS